MPGEYKHSPRWVLIAMVLSGLVLVGGCRSQAPVLGESTAESASSSSETIAAPPPALHDAATGVFLIRDEHVSYVQRTVSAMSELELGDPELLAPILEALLEGPLPQEANWGFASAIPAETRLLDISTSGTLATVNVSSQFAANSNAQSMEQRVAQVVFTLTAQDGIERVAFELDGEPLRTLGDDATTLGPSVSRDDFAEVRPDILVLSPAPGEAITSPVRVSGESSTPGGTFVIEIIGAQGTIVTEQLAGSGGTNGTWRAFETSVEFDTDIGSGELVAYGRSPVDGSRTFENRVPVVFDE